MTILYDHCSVASGNTIRIASSWLLYVPAASRTASILTMAERTPKAFESRTPPDAQTQDLNACPAV